MGKEEKMKNKDILPTIDEVWGKSWRYAYEECELQNFDSEDQITLARGHYLNGYGQAIKDLIDPDFDIKNFEHKEKKDENRN